MPFRSQECTRGDSTQTHAPPSVDGTAGRREDTQRRPARRGPSALTPLRIDRERMERSEVGRPTGGARFLETMPSPLGERGRLRRGQPVVGLYLEDDPQPLAPKRSFRDRHETAMQYPQALNREWDVYSAGSTAYGDRPARLIASVPHAARIAEPNNYEAGLPWQNSQCVTQIELQLAP